MQLRKGLGFFNETMRWHTKDTVLDLVLAETSRSYEIQAKRIPHNECDQLPVVIVVNLERFNARERE